MTRMSLGFLWSSQGPWVGVGLGEPERLAWFPKRMFWLLSDPKNFLSMMMMVCERY